MRCAKAKSLFSVAYDGEAGSEEAGLTSHFEGCLACREAYAAYAADLGWVKPALVSLAAPAALWPESSLARTPAAVPAEGLWSPWWWGLSALATSGVAVFLLVVGRSGGVAPERLIVKPLLESNFRPVELSSFAIADCLEPGYELDRSRVAHTETCPDNVRLPYRGEESSFVLEQRGEVGHTPCNGVPMVLPSGVYGCLEIGSDGGFNELRWNGTDREFRLRGELTLGQAAEVAYAIDGPPGH